MEGASTKFAMTSPMMARMAATMSPDKLVMGMLDEMSSFTTEEKKQAAAEIVNDPARAALIPKLLTVSKMMAVYP